MARLLIHVEGQTEERFVNTILAPHLTAHGYHSVAARLLGNPRLRRQRGGIRSWPTAKMEIVAHLKRDPGCFATTMVDYYGLLHEGDAAWPGRAEAAALRFPHRALCVEDGMLKDIATVIDNQTRFVPFVLIHEFEGLLFSDCDAFSKAIERQELRSQLEQVRRGFATPEEINDSPETAPSKRIEMIVRGYQKPFHGPLPQKRSAFNECGKNARISTNGYPAWNVSALGHRDADRTRNISQARDRAVN